MDDEARLYDPAALATAPALAPAEKRPLHSGDDSDDLQTARLAPAPAERVLPPNLTPKRLRERPDRWGMLRAMFGSGN